MPTRATKNKTAPGSSNPGTTDTEDLLAKAAAMVLAQLETDGIRASFGDVLRLVQLREERSTQGARTIEVRWIDPTETS